jgi:phosphocarrier protein
MEQVVVIQNEEGLHARPAGVFAKKAGEFKSQIDVTFGGQTRNAKSIMSLMGLGAKKGAELTIRAQGEDATAALETLVQLVNNKFQIQS